MKTKAKRAGLEAGKTFDACSAYETREPEMIPGKQGWSLQDHPSLTGRVGFLRSEFA
jgi:hypothetical protein